jgi:choloylglycine hydrolase
MCTAVVLNKTPAVTVSGRTIDHGVDLESQLVLKGPGNKVSTSILTKDNIRPLEWESDYGVVMVNIFGVEAYVDGMNTEGLSCSALWQSDAEPANEVAPDTRAIANITVTEYVLENAGTIAQARRLLESVSILGTSISEQKLGFHWLITDKTGDTLLVELANGRAEFYEEARSIGVVTNEPRYESQLVNLQKFTYLTNKDNQALLGANGHPISGSGMIGMPGDFTSMGRFVRAYTLVHSAQPLPAPTEGINAVVHILNNFDVPRGVLQGGVHTQWTAVHDHTNLVYCFKTYDQPSLKGVDLSRIDWAATDLVSYPLEAA